MASASPGFRFLAHRFTKSPVVMKDGSSKRFRSEDFATSGRDDGGMEQFDQIPPLPEINFKDKLLSSSCFEYTEGMEKDGFSIEASDYEVKDSPYGPSIRFSDHVKNKIYRPWKNSVIIQFVGKTHTYNFVFARLKQRWRLKGPMQLVDLDNGFFIVRFVLEEDMLCMLTGGPWVVAGQYVAVQKWRPNFCAAEEHVSRITVWVRLSGMGVEFFNSETIKCIGDLIGSSYKVDVHTVGQMRGKFARVCVEIDLNMPLIPYLVVEGRPMRVEYENLPVICFNCCRVGHSKEHCPFAKPIHKNNEPDMDMTRDIQEEMCSHQVEKGPIDPSGDKAGFGIWNVVPTRKAWKKNFKNGTTASDDKGKGVSPEVVHKRQEKTFYSSNNLPQKDKKEVIQKGISEAGTYDASGSIFNILENECFDSEQEHVFGTLENHLSSNGKTVQSKDDGGWNAPILTNKGKKKIGRPRKLDQALSNLRKPMTSFDNGGLEIGEVEACRNEAADQDMEIQDLRDYVSVQLESEVGEALIADVSACCAEDGKAQEGQPRISSSKARKVISQLGFPKAEISDAVGFSGGIWLLWDDAKFNLRVIHCMDQAVSHGLIDLGFLGPKFTWVNKRAGGDFVMKRLDRVICNKEWRIPSAELKPFRFEAMWLKHCLFPEFIQAEWKNLEGSVSIKLDLLIPLLREWNTQVFGQIFQKKKRILARLQGIQRALCKGFSPFLSNLEKQLQQEFENLLDQEDVFWKQKSRIEYFHGLFLDDFVDIIRSPLPSLFPHISEADLAAVSNEVTEKEVQDALLAIGPYKAPSPDGYSAIFFHNHWCLCKKDIEDLVFKCFSSGSVPESLNSTLVTLVPKITNPQSMLQFRPISLCNTLYKVVSKIIVGRLRPLMCKFVSPNQVSFVPGRQISDNIFIAQEVLHRFHRARGKTGYIAWKIDLSKAYDRLKWSFIEQTLAEIGIGETSLHLIMSCVKNVSYRIILNEELTESIKPQRGVRQGDPLSPYLFVLCMEKLSHIIAAKVLKKEWKAVRAARSGPLISHLFFADDLILFGEASAQQAMVMKNSLEEFCELSGQQVNFEKSLLYISANTKSDLVDQIELTCGATRSADMGNYLGVPLVQGRVTKAMYKGVLVKVQAKLAAWKSQLLSMAGRITLIQSVASSIPLYTMQTAMLPQGLCEDLDKSSKSFLWGSSENYHKTHLVKWDTVCLPKRLGGLGIKKASLMNQAMLSKASWRIVVGDSGLWAAMLRKKYLRGSFCFDAYDDNCTLASSSWKGLIYGAAILNKGMKWRV
ncbi:unnamed protein product [Prunus armeniaca]